MAFTSGGVTTSVDADAVIPVILSRARVAQEKKTVMMSFVTSVTIRNGQGNTYNWPKFEEFMQAQALTENVPIDNPQRLIPASHQFTTSEVGVYVVITDQTVEVTPEAMVARSGTMMGNAMKRKQEEDLLSLLAGFSRDIGAAGAAFDPQDIAAAYTRLIAGAEAGTQEEQAEGQVYAVIHPFHYHDVLTPAATIGSNIADGTNGYYPLEGISSELSRRYHLKELYNTVLAIAPLISIDGSDDAVGGIFTKDALLHVRTSRMARVEKQRDITLRAMEMVVTSRYGTAELEDQFGLAITADATVPS